MDTKLCSKCGETKPASSFYLNRTGKPHSYCKTCHKQINKSNREKWNKKEGSIVLMDEYRKYKSLSIETRSDTLLRAARGRSKKKGNASCFDIDSTWIANKLRIGVCEATGIQFDLERKQKCGRTRSPWSPSLDRIDNAKGYTKDNVQVVVWLYNQAKGDSTREEFMTLVHALATPLFRKAINSGKIKLVA